MSNRPDPVTAAEPATDIEGRGAMPGPVASTFDAGPAGWTGGRIAALLIGALFTLIGVSTLATGSLVLWGDRTMRDSGYVTTDTHEFSTAGSALVTDPVELGSPGVEWLYSGAVLGKVRIRVAPVTSGFPVFVGIGPAADVQRYLSGVDRSIISDLWTDSVRTVGGGRPHAVPGSQDFWVAASTGAGPRTLRWDPTNGSWSVVVMNADGRPGVDVRTDVGATAPSLAWIGSALLIGAVIFLAVGVLLISGAIRRSRSRG